MEYEDSTARQESQADLPPTPPPPEAAGAREPVALLVAGITLYALLLLLSWWRSGERVQPASLGLDAQAARSSTYLVEYFRYQQLRRSLFGTSLSSAVPQTARQAAERWATISDTSPEKAYAARTTVNAAALFDVAGDRVAAREAMARAVTLDPAQGAAYREIGQLYEETPRSTTFSARTQAYLDSISTGPLIRARRAELAGDPPAALAALQPGAKAGLRVLVINSSLGFLVITIFLTAIILTVVYFRRIRQALSAVAFPAASQPWGAGTALILVSTVYLLSSGITALVVSLLGINPQTNFRGYLLVSAPMTACCTIAILSLFLVLLGHRPWDWGVFGWRASRRGMGYGVLSLLISYPVIWGVSLISVTLFRDHMQSHPLIPLLQSSRDPWVIFLLALMAVVMAPLVEETLFRGVLFPALNARLPFWPAALISGGLFAAGHTQLVALLPIAVLGVLFAFLARRTESLWASATAHAVFNGLTTVIALLTAWSLQGPGQ